MTQDEVDLMYNYLHEQYEYNDGNLIRKDNKKIIMGYTEKSKKLSFRCSFRVYGIKTSMPYSHAIYIYHKKIKPSYISHINKNPADNRIENLKIINHAQMMNECDLEVRNKNGYKGVIKDHKRYGARIWNGKSYTYLGWFNTPKEAHEAYLKAKNERT